MFTLNTRPGNHGQFTDTPARGLHTTIRNVITLLAVFLLPLLSSNVFAQSSKMQQARFQNVADSTQGLSDFSQFPAINSRGAVAFVASQPDGTQAIFKSDRRALRTIASTSTSPFTFFSDDVVINASGTVAFRANLPPGRTTGIFTGDGAAVRTIFNSAEQGLPGFGVGPASMNAAGTVAFSTFRNGFRSSLIFTGKGGPPTPVFDTLVQNVGALGAVAINQRGEIVFRAVQRDRSEGIFLLPSGTNGDGGPQKISAAPTALDLVDTKSGGFSGFGDPAINSSGVVADFGRIESGLEFFSATTKGLVARISPAASLIVDVEHPSINDSGAIAFSAFLADGGQAIFAVPIGGASPVAVLQTGDALFGSRVTALSVGRFALNDHLQLAFQYELEDGRTGIGVASLNGEDDQLEE